MEAAAWGLRNITKSHAGGLDVLSGRSQAYLAVEGQIKNIVYKDFRQILLVLGENNKKTWGVKWHWALPVATFDAFLITMLGAKCEELDRFISLSLTWERVCYKFTPFQARKQRWNSEQN